MNIKKYVLLPISLLGWFCGYGVYYSQYQQDEILNEYVFKNKKNGIFVDIGAHDGITINNTYFFEKELGWTGLCIEPMPDVFEKLKKNRTCRCIQGCIAPQAGKAQFLRVIGDQDKILIIEMLSGLVERYEQQHLKRIDDELTKHGGSKQILEVECYTINDLLEQNNIKYVDYLSIDTEGGELEILKSIDYQRFDIRVIDVENNYDDPLFRLFMVTQGYVLVGKLCCDEIYVKNNQ